jgi:ribosomal protein L12E/L44/L45/RPP1/RPP2
MNEEEEERASAIWRAVRGGTSTPSSLLLDDVLAALRATRICTATTTPPTTTTTTAAAAAAAADDQLAEKQAAKCGALVQEEEEEEGLLEEVWWWLFVSQGANACLAFLLGGDDDEQQGTAARAHSNKVEDEDEDEDGREEVFLALAPAVLDRLLHQRVAYRGLRRKLRECVLVWQRVRQACFRVRQGGHSSIHNDYRQAELVRLLLRCLTGGGIRRWEETGFFEQVVLHHTNVAVVLGTPHTCAHTCTPRNRGLRHTHAHAHTLTRTMAHVQRASTTSWTMETIPICCSSCSAITTSECARP